MYRFLIVAVTLFLVISCISDEEDADSTPTPEPAATETPAPEGDSTGDEPTPAENDESTTTPSPAESTPTEETETVVTEPMPFAGTLGEPATPRMPVDVAPTPDGGTAVLDMTGQSVHFLDSDGTLERTIELQFDDADDPGSFLLVALTIGEDGNIFVVLGPQNHLLKFDADGEFVDSRELAGRSGQAIDLELGPGGEIYLLAGHNRSPQRNVEYGIHIFDSDLNEVDFWEAPDVLAPLDLTFGPDGSAFVLLAGLEAPAEEHQNAQPAIIVEIEPGAYDEDVWQSAQRTTDEAGVFNGIVALDGGGFVLIEERGSNSNDPEMTRLVQIDDAGQTVNVAKVPDQGRSLLQETAGIAALPDGNLALADPLGARALLLTVEGETLAEFKDNEPDHFSEPAAIARGPDDDIYVADIHLGKIVIFDAFGEYQDVYQYPVRQALPLDPTPIGLAISSDGQVVITRPGPPFENLFRVGPDGAEDITPETNTPSAADERPFLFYPRSLAIGPDGLLYIAFQNYPYVRVYDLDGEFVSQWPETDNRREVGHMVTAVAADDDDVYALVRAEVNGEDGAAIKPLSDPEGETVIAEFSPDSGDSDGVIDAGPVSFSIAERSGSISRFYVVDAVNEAFVSIRSGGDESWRREIDDFESRRITGITVTGQEIVYLTDSRNAEVMMYAPEG